MNPEKDVHWVVRPSVDAVQLLAEGKVDASGEVKRCPPGAAVTGCPHAKQKAAPVGSSVLHLAHASVRRVPHFIQKFACAGFSCWHCGHVMPSPSRACAGERCSVWSVAARLAPVKGTHE